MKIFHWTAAVVLTLAYLSLCSTSETNTTNIINNEEEILNNSLNARIIHNQEEGAESYQAEKSISGPLLEEEEEEEEEEESGFYVDTSSLFEHENTTVPEITAPVNKSKVVASIDNYLTTAEGVDPNDPEELARKKHYGSHLDVFDRIVAINRNANETNRLEEGDVRHHAPNPFRNAGGGSLWPKRKRGALKGLVPIPYVLSPQYNSSHITIIKSAMRSYAKHTCIRFLPRISELSYLSIRDQGGCWAYVGKTGYSAQTVSLGIPGCVTKGIALHELMHAVGFQHEHSRNDRDKFVRVLHNNVQGGMEDNFDKHSFTKNLVVYDYGSVMHYSQHAFSKQPYLPSIEIYPKRKPEPRIGQRTRLSPYDIEEIKYLYNCDSSSYKRCGKDFVNRERGSFQSPFYSKKPYPKNSHCTWNITVRPGRFIQLTFHNIEILDSPLCGNDAILIHDGKNASAPILRRICGTYSSRLHVTSTGSQLYVIFSSDMNQNSNSGFRATFRQTSRQGVRTPYPTAPTLGAITATVRNFHCDFEHGFCGMTQDSLDDLNYLLQNGGTPSRDTGPTGDHTTGNGYYIFVESSLPAEVGDNAIIRSPWFDRTNVFCVTFSYNMLGSYMGGLRLYAFKKTPSSDYGDEELLWEIHGNQGRRWHTKRVTYRPRGNVQNVQFYWESYIYYYQSDIAMDDLSIVPGDCSSVQHVAPTSPAVIVWTSSRRTSTPKVTTRAPTTTTTTNISNRLYSKLNCTFENGPCEFSQSSSDNFDWMRNRGHTPSASTGPSQDHTTGSGAYMFIEASSPRRLGHVARLESPPLTPDRHCLRLWYHMYGKQTGKLSVWQVINGVSSLLAEKVGDSGNRWIPLTVDVNSPNIKKSGRRRDTQNDANSRLKIDENEEVQPEIVEEGNEYNSSRISRDAANTRRTPSQNSLSNDLQIFIDASVGRGYAGDIAIDDIEITDAACQTQIVLPTSNVLLDQFSCDFENQQQYCGFVQSQDDDFDWVLNSGPTGSSGTGPNVDHTTNSNQGVYIYTESSSPRYINDVAELMTPPLRPRPYCIRFAYHMHGSATGEINLYSREKLQGRRTFLNPTRLWNEAGPQGDVWLTAAVDFSPSSDSQAVQIIFQGIIGTSFTSDMALDDVSITSGLCSPSTTTTTSAAATSFTTTIPTTITTTTTTTTTTTSTTNQPTTRSTATTQPTTIKATTTIITTTRPTTTKKATTTTTTTTTPQSTSTSTKLATSKTTIQSTSAQKIITTNQLPTTRSTTTLPPTTTSSTTKASTTRSTTTLLPTTTSSTTKASTTRSTTTLPPTTISSTTKASTTTSTIAQTSAAIQTTQATSTTGTIPKTNQTKLTSIPVTISSPYPQVFSCNFDSISLCGMKQSSNDEFDWVARQLRTPSKKTGPTGDHTISDNGKGKYLYVEASSPRRKNDVAVISTPKLAVQTSKRCLVFWYNMWGKGMGSLNVFADFYPILRSRKSATSTSNVNRLVHSETGNQGQSWKMAKLEIYQQQWLQGGSVQFSFHGVRGKSYQSDMAIDDICIAEGPCDSTSRCSDNGFLRSTDSNPSVVRPVARVRSISAAVTATTPHSTTTALRTPVAGGPALWSGMPRCSFEMLSKRGTKANPTTIPGRSIRDSGPYTYPDKISNTRMCGLKQMTGKRDQFDWRFNRGHTLSRATGPDGDKTTGSGYYLYIESSKPRKENDAAFLYSYPMPPSEYCVDLSYHMKGTFIGSLAVQSLQRLSDGRTITTLLSNVVGNQGPRWKNLKVNYRPRTDTQFVAFRFDGIVGKDYRGDIAIDDVAILPGRCNVCSKPNHRYVNNLNQQQSFFTGCVDTSLFWVRCCSLTQERVVYRRVTRCNPYMFKSARLHWYCNNM